MWSDAPVTARVAFVLMMIYGAIGTAWVIGEVLTDPGSVAGVSISVTVVVAEVVLSMLVVRLPRLAPTFMGVAVAVLLALAVVEAIVSDAMRGPGPVVAIAALVIAVPLAFLGLRSARLGGWLLVAAGMAPVVEIVARAVSGGGGGLHLGGSSGVVAVPLILVGLLFLLAAISGPRRSREGTPPS